jgi:hypothetical protein
MTRLAYGNVCQVKGILDSRPRAVVRQSATTNLRLSALPPSPPPPRARPSLTRPCVVGGVGVGYGR